MKNTLRFDHDARCIVMDRVFYKNSSNIRFEEYGMLQRARQDYPTYTPVIRRIKRIQRTAPYFRVPRKGAPLSRNQKMVSEAVP